MLTSNMILAVFFALTFLVGVLMLAGPTRVSAHHHRQWCDLLSVLLCDCLRPSNYAPQGPRRTWHNNETLGASGTHQARKTKIRKKINSAKVDHQNQTAVAKGKNASPGYESDPEGIEIEMTKNGGYVI